MSSAPPFMSAQEIREIAGRTAAAVLPDEVAETMPVPRRKNDNVVLLIMYYTETGPPNKREVGLPHHAMELNPSSGDVLRFWACSPEELGIEPPLSPVEGADIPQGMTSDEFVEKRQEFLDISSRVWEAYYHGDTQVSGPTADLVKRYYALFLEITKKEVAPYYVAAAGDFFNWVKSVTPAP
jgi:hypothetical protein